jgi:hypothetical protein
LREGNVWKRHPWQAHGRELFANPRAFGESVDVLTHEPPIFVRLEFVKAR